MASKKSTSNQKPVLSKKSPQTSTSTTVSTPKNKPNYTFILAAAAVVILALAYIFKGTFIVATVNGELLPRSIYIKALEAQGGQEILDNLIVERLILQEADKQGVIVPQAEIDTQIGTIEQNFTSQGQDLDTALADRSMTRADLQRQIQVSRLVELLSQQNVVVSDEEVAQYIASNAAQLEDMESEEGFEDMVKDQLTQEKSQSATQTWIEDIRSQADINYW
jgi:hypothetical protein